MHLSGKRSKDKSRPKVRRTDIHKMSLSNGHVSDIWRRSWKRTSVSLHSWNKTSNPGSGAIAATSTVPTLPRADNADHNPMIEERPWFISFHAVGLPIQIGEAADAAFATRLRQAVSKQPVSHLPRIQYVNDDVLRSLAEQPPEWPSSSHLKFLVDVALKTFGKTFHIVRRSVVWKAIQQLIQDSSSCDWLTQCQIWALLAIGEAYSARSALPNRPFPGTRYWARAMWLMYMPFERPSLQVIEIYLLLVGKSFPT